ncbi:TPA: hypothetical protein ACSP1Y_004396 [Aeromonas hydrophila]|uniref:hypothetical protein n=1 Tax=Aeromonas hydrophila TaxID=644 RepID=UPI0021E6821D|nr:hypothetical protein [Aeromonas hydrophila]MCV3276618.1 hypothetical protein [Aeromonas hydrophila]
MNFLWRFGLFSRQAAKKPTFSVVKQPFGDKRVVSLRFYAKKFPFHFFTQPRFPSPVADCLALVDRTRQQAHARLAVPLKNKIQRGNTLGNSPKPAPQTKGAFSGRGFALSLCLRIMINSLN